MELHPESAEVQLHGCVLLCRLAAAAEDVAAHDDCVEPLPPPALAPPPPGRYRAVLRALALQPRSKAVQMAGCEALTQFFDADTTAAAASSGATAAASAELDPVAMKTAAAAAAAVAAAVASWAEHGGVVERGLWALDAVAGEPQLLGAAGLDAGSGAAAQPLLDAALVGLWGGLPPLNVEHRRRQRQRRTGYRHGWASE